LNKFEKHVVAWSIAWEGSISLHKRSKGTRLQTKIWISNTEKELLDKFLDIIKVGVIKHNRNATKNHKALWEWRVTSQSNCSFILRSILEYLPSSRKKQIAELVLKFIKIRTEANPYSEKEWKIFEKVRQLNRRGYRIINDNKEVKANVNS